MAGKAGMKGGGGARTGAGRKPKPKQAPVVIPVTGDVDMLKLLQDVALGRIDASTVQVRAAIAAVQYTHAKVGEGGKKEKRQADAQKVAGRFTPSAPPKLAAAGGKRV